jgi:hypothetical protein
MRIFRLVASEQSRSLRQERRESSRRRPCGREHDASGRVGVMAHDIRRIEKEIGQLRSSREGEEASGVSWHPCSMEQLGRVVG